MADRTETRSPALVGAVMAGTVLLVVLTGCEADNSIIRQRGFVALHQGNQAKAFDAFSCAVRRDPTDWRAQYELGKLLLAQGQPLDAGLTLDKALSLRPDHPETSGIIDCLAEAIYQQKRYDDLHALLTEATEEFGNSGDYLRQGEYLMRMGQIDDVRVAYLKAVQFADRDDAKPCIALAEFYEHVGDSAKAIGAWKRAYYIAPKNEKVANKLREHGIVPGPTLTSPPRR